MNNTKENIDKKEAAFFERIREQIANAPEGVDVTAFERVLRGMQTPSVDLTKIWFLLDRSGSMQSLADDVIGGYNSYIADRADGNESATMTTVQFDSQDPFEIIDDGCDIKKVRDLTRSTYQPRGGTPLYDAIGKLVKRVDQRIEDRAVAGLPPEDQLIIIFTDGMENDSRTFNREKIFDLIKDRSAQDWTFVFMGANQDSYLEGHKVGLVDGNVQDYEATPENVRMAFESMSRATSAYAGKSRVQRTADKDSFFGDLKEAEAAIRRARRRR